MACSRGDLKSALDDWQYELCGYRRMLASKAYTGRFSFGQKPNKWKET